MYRVMTVLVLLFATLDVAPLLAQSSKYPPLSEYMTTPEAEIALARSAAPENVSAHARSKYLLPLATRSGPKAAMGLSVWSCGAGRALPPSRPCPSGK
jgi:hypothetical protein